MYTLLLKSVSRFDFFPMCFYGKQQVFKKSPKIHFLIVLLAVWFNLLRKNQRIKESKNQIINIYFLFDIVPMGYDSMSFQLERFGENLYCRCDEVHNQAKIREFVVNRLGNCCQINYLLFLFGVFNSCDFLVLVSTSLQRLKNFHIKRSN